MPKRILLIWKSLIVIFIIFLIVIYSYFLKNLPKKFEVTFFETKAINSTAKLLIYYTSNFEGFAELLSPLKEKVDFSKISSGSHILFLNLAKKVIYL
jgi:hypothetical protein